MPVETSRSSRPSSCSLLLASGNEIANCKPTLCSLASSAIRGKSNDVSKIARNENRRTLVFELMDILLIAVLVLVPVERQKKDRGGVRVGVVRPGSRCADPVVRG